MFIFIPLPTMFLQCHFCIFNLTHLFQCTFSLTTGNIRKPYGFLMFSGGRERVYWERIGQECFGSVVYPSHLSVFSLYSSHLKIARTTIKRRIQLLLNTVIQLNTVIFRNKFVSVSNKWEWI